MSVEYICDGCGKRQPGTSLAFKPADWFSRIDPGLEGRPHTRRELHACSRPCIERVVAARDAQGSLRGVASEIIRLYHSPAPIRENLDLIQRHGLAMARALVEIDTVVCPYADATHGRTFANTLAECVAAILDGAPSSVEGAARLGIEQ